MALRKNLPIPGSGAGTAVATADMAAKKTILVSGLPGASATVEAAGDAGVFCPVAFFIGGGVKTVYVACTQMRVRVGPAGGPGSIDVIAESGFAQSAALAMPAGDGDGASSAISPFGSEMSAFVAGSFTGMISVSLSPDNSSFEQAFRSFAQSESEFRNVSGQFARVTRQGVIALTPGAPTAEVCGMVSPVFEPSGTTDITTELQAFINATAAARVEAVLGAGIYTISSTITIPTNSNILGYGAVIQPVLSWALPLTPALSITGTDIAVEGLEIDARGDVRDAANVVAQNMMVNNAQRVRLKNLHFRDAGAMTGLPTGPSLILVSKDLIGDFDANTGVVGPCTDVTIEGCRFTQVAGALVAFAFRAVSDWTVERAKNAFTNHTERIRMLNCEFAGEGGATEPFPFNVTEFAGGGTRDFWVENCTYDGKTVHPMDADKGCYQGQFIGNRVTNSGKSTLYVGDAATRFAAMVAHGSSATYLTTDILFQHNEIYDCVSASVDPYEAFCLVQDAQHIRFLDNFGSDLNSGVYGYGSVVDRNVLDVQIARNTFLVVQGICSTNVSAEGFIDVCVADNIAPTCEGTPLVFGSAAVGAGTETGLQVRGNIARTASAAGIACNVTDRWADAVIESNDLTGNSEGIRVGAGLAIVRNNWTRDQTTYGYRFAAGAVDTTAVGNRSTGAGTAQHIIESGAVVRGGTNSWFVYPSLVSLVSGASVVVDAGVGNTFDLVLADAAVTLEAPINAAPGMVLNFTMAQDGAGARALTFDAAYLFSASAPALPVGIGDQYLVSGVVQAVVAGVATVILCSRTGALV